MCHLRKICTYLIALTASSTCERFGVPIARPTSTPSLFKKSVVGVDRISILRTNSRFDSASIWAYRTSGIVLTMSSSRALVARHGEQKADENCTIVTREPSSTPITAASSFGPLNVFFLRNSPRLRVYQTPNVMAKTSTTTSGVREFTWVFLHLLWQEFSY